MIFLSTQDCDVTVHMESLKWVLYYLPPRILYYLTFVERNHFIRNNNNAVSNMIYKLQTLPVITVYRPIQLWVKLRALQ